MIYKYTPDAEILTRAWLWPPPRSPHREEANPKLLRCHAQVAVEALDNANTKPYFHFHLSITTQLTNIEPIIAFPTLQAFSISVM